MDARRLSSIYDFCIKVHCPAGLTVLCNVEDIDASFEELGDGQARLAEFRLSDRLRPHDEIAADSVQALKAGHFHIAMPDDMTATTASMVLPSRRLIRYQEVERAWAQGEPASSIRYHGGAGQTLSETDAADFAANRVYMLGPPAADMTNAAGEKVDALIVSEALWLWEMGCTAGFIADFIWFRTGTYIAVGDLEKLVHARNGYETGFLGRDKTQGYIFHQDRCGQKILSTLPLGNRHAKFLKARSTQ